MEAARMTRVVLLRTGLVLDARAGAAEAGASLQAVRRRTVGSGEQVLVVRFCCDDWTRLDEVGDRQPGDQRPINLTAPSPVTNREFAERARRTRCTGRRSCRHPRLRSA